MRFLPLFLLLTLVSGFSSAVESVSAPHIRVSLISENSAVEKGAISWVGVLFSPEEHWHTYWLNSGDSGAPPEVKWELSGNASIGEPLWSFPQSIPIAHLMNFGYFGDALLMFPLAVGDNASISEVELKAKVSWLVCEEVCIPGKGVLSLTLPISNAGSSEKSASAPLFVSARLKHPQPLIGKASFEVTDDAVALRVDSAIFNSGEIDQWRVVPFSGEVINHASEAQILQSNKQLNVVMQRSDLLLNPPDSTRWLLIGDDRIAYEVEAAPISGALGNVGDASIGFFTAFIFAVLGGLILNLMPCVLPVLSLKALSFVEQKAPVVEGMFYTFGVVVSFMLIASLLLAFKAGGEAIGWGFQLQSPLVVALLAYLFFVIGLNFLNILSFSGSFMGVGQALTKRRSHWSGFFTGVLAVIVASPCTAPFMGAALGYALLSSTAEALFVFLGLAVGFAAPLAILSGWPRLRKLLPKPGSWMESLKQFLAFPMFAASVWLLAVLGGQVGHGGIVWILSGFLFLGLYGWLKHISGERRNFVAYAVVATAFLPLFFLPKLPDAQATPRVDFAEPFSQDALEKARAGNELVFVNMTADWCITCKVNEQLVFSDEIVIDLIADGKVRYMVGDWTNRNEEIFVYLKSFQRVGVPLYVLYPGQANPEVLPQFLTPALVKTAIINALEEIKNETSG